MPSEAVTRGWCLVPSSQRAFPGSPGSACGHAEYEREAAEPAVRGSRRRGLAGCGPGAWPQCHGPARLTADWVAPGSPWSVDHHAQPLAGSGERALDLLVVLAFGEDEAQVPVSFGERIDGLADGDGDGQGGDCGHGR